MLHLYPRFIFLFFFPRSYYILVGLAFSFQQCLAGSVAALFYAGAFLFLTNYAFFLFSALNPCSFVSSLPGLRRRTQLAFSSFLPLVQRRRSFLMRIFSTAPPPECVFAVALSVWPLQRPAVHMLFVLFLYSALITLSLGFFR